MGHLTLRGFFLEPKTRVIRASVGTQMVEVEPVRDIHSNFFSDVRCNSIHLLLNLQYMSRRIPWQKTDG